MNLRLQDLSEIGRLTDISTVRCDVDMLEVEEMIRLVKYYRCICASPMPWITDYVVRKLADTPDTVVTGVVGFPSGADSTEIKIATAKQMVAVGCRELDMVMNVSAFKSGYYDLVERDIRAVVESAAGIPVKVILEICYLGDDEIARASEIGVKAGAAYIKTGTGWGGKPTTEDTIRLIRRTIGNAAKIKAAGGIRDLDTLLRMYECGCDRFGIGVRSATQIFKEAYLRAGKQPID